MPDYVDWFVNREKQFNGFLKMLAGETPKRVMVVVDRPDMGKSWLAQRLRHHCEEAGIPALHVDFRDPIPHDYLSLVRMARDQLGGEHFEALTRAINGATTVQIALPSEAAATSSGVTIQDVSGSTVSVGGSVVGGNLIQDNQFFVQGDSPVARQAAEIRINDAFFDCLAALLQKGPVVFLFDSCEEITNEAALWLQGYLLPRLRGPAMQKAIVLLTGRETPPVDEGLQALVASTALGPLDESHVREYFTRRKIEGLDIPTVFKTSGGNPKFLSMMADAASVKAGSDDDWL